MESLKAKIVALETERDALKTERDALIIERDALAARLRNQRAPARLLNNIGGRRRKTRRTRK